MSIKSSTIATLLIAGTAIGGSALAVTISNTPVSANQQNQLQVVQPNANTPATKQKLATGGKIKTIEPGAVRASVQTPSPSTSPTPTTPPVTPPPAFGGGGSNGSDDGQGEDDNNSGYGQHPNHCEDNEGSDD